MSLKNILIIFKTGMISLLIFTFVSCSSVSHNSDNNSTSKNIERSDLNISDSVKSVILHHLEYQYGIGNNLPESIYTKEFLSTQTPISLRGDLNPYKLISINQERPVNNLNADFEIDIRISDKKGEYIQHISLVKNDNNYLILSIDNDI